jgi:hypothetical protein
MKVMAIERGFYAGIRDPGDCFTVPNGETASWFVPWEIGNDGSALEEASLFLVGLLATRRELSVKTVEAMASANGISLRTLKRAKKALGIVSKKQGCASGWRWVLP